MKILSTRSVIVAIVLAEILLAALLILPGIGDRSLWLDETATAQMSINPDWYWSSAVGNDPNMWLYVSFMQGWCKLSLSETWLRLFSALFAFACIPMIVRVGSRLFSSSAGLLAGFFLVVHPFFIEYAREARAYSLMMFMSLWATDAFVRMLKAPSTRSGVTYGLAVVLGIYTQFYIAMLSLVQALSLLIIPIRKWPWRSLFIAAGVIIAGVVLMVIFVGPRGTGIISWMSAPAWENLLYACGVLLGSGTYTVWFYTLCLLSAAILALVSHHSRWSFGFLVILAIVPVLLAYLVAVSIIPLFQPRFLSFVVPVLALIAGGVLQKIRPAIITLLLVASFAYGSVAPINYVLNKPSPEDWRGLAEHVRNDGREGDVLICHARYLIGPVKIYKRMYGEYPVRLFDFYTVETGAADADQQAPDDKYIKELADGHERLWLVLGHNVFTHMGSDVETAKLMRSLDARFAQEEGLDFGNIKLQLWVKKGGAN